jgi:hypothetical protein
MPRGFGPLQSSDDLIAKLRHDLDRIEADPLDAYAAFDFMVTARHFPDWDPTRRLHLQSNPYMKVVTDLADGAKHFGERRDKTPRPEAFTVSGAFDPNVFQHDAFDVGRLMVRLEGDEAAQLGDELDVGDLARAVLKLLTSSAA